MSVPDAATGQGVPTWLANPATTLDSEDAAAEQIKHYQTLLQMQKGMEWSERALTSFRGLLDQWSPEERDLLGVVPYVTIARTPDVFALAAWRTYSEYVRDELLSLVTASGEIIDIMAGTPRIAACTLEYSLKHIAAAIFGPEDMPPPSSLAEHCAPVKRILETWDKTQQVIGALNRMTSDFSAEESWNLMGEVLITATDLASDRETKHAVFAFSKDANALGELVGSLVAIAFWEVVTTLATQGFNQLGRLSKIAKAMSSAGVTST